MDSHSGDLLQGKRSEEKADDKSSHFPAKVIAALIGGEWVYPAD